MKVKDFKMTVAGIVSLEEDSLKGYTETDKWDTKEIPQGEENGKW